MKRIFVAGGSDERGEVAAAIDALRVAGWEVMFDWPKSMNEEPPNPSPGRLYELGGQMENALVSSTLLWLMLPRAKSEGAAYEFGFFRGLIASQGNLSKGVIVSGPIDSIGRLYPYRAAAQGRIFDEHLEALEYLCGMV